MLIIGLNIFKTESLKEKKLGREDKKEARLCQLSQVMHKQNKEGNEYLATSLGTLFCTSSIFLQLRSNFAEVKKFSKTLTRLIL